jgi:hypothetical protein
MDMDATEEIKLTYKFEWGKMLSPPGVEIDPPRGKQQGIRVVAGSKPKLCIPC